MDGHVEGPVERLLYLMDWFAEERSEELRLRLVDLLKGTGVRVYVRMIADEAKGGPDDIGCERLMLETGPDGREVPGLKSFTDPNHQELARPVGDALVHVRAVCLAELFRCCDARGVLLLTIDHDSPHGIWLARENWKDSPLVPIMPPGTRSRGAASGPVMTRLVHEHVRNLDLN